MATPQRGWRKRDRRLMLGNERPDHRTRAATEQDDDAEYQQHGRKIAPTRSSLSPDTSPQYLSMMLHQ
jgi:hypothetical protein